MKVAAVSDLHLREQRLSEQVPVLRAIEREIAVAKPDLITIGGDTYQWSVPATSTIFERNTFMEFVLNLAAVAPVISVRGNHDTIGDLAFMNHLRTSNPVRHFDRPGFHVEKDRPSHVLVALPWMDRSAFGPEEDWQEATLKAWRTVLDQARSHAPKRVIVVAHAALKGAVLIEGQPPVPVHDPTFAVRDLLPDMDVPMVLIAGHYHVPQAVGVLGAYPGSPFVHTFGDKGKRGWMLVDLPDEGSPVFLWKPIAQPARIAIDYLAATDEIVQPENPVEPVKGDHVRIVASFHDRDSVTAMDNVRDFERELTERGCLVEVRCEIQRARREREGAEAVAGDSPLGDRLRAYAATCQDPPGDDVVNRAVERVTRWSEGDGT